MRKIISFIFIVFMLFTCYLIKSDINDSLSIRESSPDSLFYEHTDLDSVFYQANSVHYNVIQNKIDLIGNSRLQYHNSSIESDKISLCLNNRQAKTEGLTILRDGTQIVLGESINFDIETLTGRITNVSGRFDKGFYHGTEVRKVSDEVFDIDDGYFTTCENKEPSFYIYSSRMRLFHNNRVVAKPVVFYVNHFPILALPYAAFSVKRDRATGFLVPEPGYNNVDGKYIENIAFYHFFDDYVDMLFAFDYRELTGWESRYDLNYLKRYHYRGSLRTRLQRRIHSPIHTSTEWMIRARHNQEFLDSSTLNCNIEFISSRNIWEGSDLIDERLTQRVTSTVAYRKPIGNSAVNINASYNEDLVENRKNLTLPNISYSLPSKPFYELFNFDENLRKKDFWWKNFSYSYNFRAVHVGTINDPNPTFWDILYKNKKDEHGNYINQHNFGVRHTGSINYNTNLRGWLTINQSLRANEVWYDRDRRSNSPARAMDYNYSSRFSSSVYGFGSYPNFFLRAVRHTLTPSVTYNYTPDFSHNREKYYNFGGISVNTGSRRRIFSFGLDNKWSFKYFNKRTDREITINDLFSLSTTFSYDLEKEGKKFSNLAHNASFRPPSLNLFFLNLNYSNNLSLVQNFYDYNVENWKISNRLNFSGSATYTDYFPKEKNAFITQRFETPGEIIEDANDDFIPEDYFYFDDSIFSGQDTWRVSIEHDYNKNRLTDFSSSSLRSNTSFKITNNWSVTYSNYYNIKIDQLISQSLSITRNLDGWNLYFTWSKQGNYWSYRIMLYNLKLPDSMRIRRTDRKRN